MNSYLTLSICILHFNNDDLTNECLKSVLRQKIHYVHEIIIIDNGSEVPYICPNGKVRVIRVSENVGNIGGQNKCFESALGEHVLFISNDVTLKENCIDAMMKRAEYCPSYGQIMPVIQEPFRTNYGLDLIWPGYAKTITKIHSTVPVIPSIIYLMKKKVWKKIGGFDEGFASSHEDVDMGLRLQQFMLPRLVALQADAYHEGNQTLKDTIKDPKGTFHKARVELIKKHFKGPDCLLRLGAIHAARSLSSAGIF